MTDHISLEVLDADGAIRETRAGVLRAGAGFVASTTR